MGFEAWADCRPAATLWNGKVWLIVAFNLIRFFGDRRRFTTHVRLLAMLMDKNDLMPLTANIIKIRFDCANFLVVFLCAAVPDR